MAWPHLCPFIAVDAAFTKVIHNYVLLIATALDANNVAINLAWGIARKENLDHWSWFFDNLDLALDNLNRPSVVIMSNRQKGIKSAVQTRLANVTEAYCCKHIERQLVGGYGKEIIPLSWKAVDARTKAKFELAMDELKSRDPW